MAPEKDIQTSTKHSFFSICNYQAIFCVPRAHKDSILISQCGRKVNQFPYARQ